MTVKHDKDYVNEGFHLSFIVGGYMLHVVSSVTPYHGKPGVEAHLSIRDIGTLGHERNVYTQHYTSGTIEGLVLKIRETDLREGLAGGVSFADRCALDETLQHLSTTVERNLIVLTQYHIARITWEMYEKKLG